MNILKIITVCTCLLISGILHAQAKTTNLAFGLYTNDKPSTLVKQFSPILEELETGMESVLGHNVTISLKITKTYQDAIELLSNGAFDFVRFGPVAYTKAKDLNDGIDIIVLESVQNSKVFYGIVARKNGSNIPTIQDIKGKRFAFGDRQSTIGRYLAQQFLRQNNIKEHDLSDYSYLDRHDIVGREVSNGKYDAGALKENTFLQLISEGYDLVEIGRFPNVTKPWIASANMDAKIKDAMREAFLQIENSEILSKLGIDGFLEGSDADYDVIRDAIENNHLFFTR